MRVFLETERLLLRPFAETDVDRLLALHSDPEVMRFINGGKPTSSEEVEREYRERFAGDGARRGRVRAHKGRLGAAGSVRLRATRGRWVERVTRPPGSNTA